MSYPSPKKKKRKSQPTSRLTEAGLSVCLAAPRRRYPLMTPSGRSCATRLLMPAEWTTSTTSLTSL